MTVAVAEARAKVNLHLHVVGRRPDGYHLLDSLVAFAGVGDTVEVRAGRGLSLSVEGPMADGLAGERDNLVLKAARALADGLGRPPDLAIRLVKRLPVASGIGGGSADAAATLRAAAALWDLPPGAPVLARVAPPLGADVPVCLLGRAVNMGGVGEVLDPAPVLPRAWMVLVNPGVACPTPAVFRARTGLFSAPDPLVEAPPDVAALGAALGRRRNDLTAAAVTLLPVVAEVLERLHALDGCRIARMSGSGATCFALFDDEDAARRAAATLGGAHPGWWTAACPLLSDANAER